MEKLLEIYASDQRRRDEVVVTKWSLVLDAYHRIRKTILNNHLAMNATNIQLPLLNKKKPTPAVVSQNLCLRNVFMILCSTVFRLLLAL